MRHDHGSVLPADTLAKMSAKEIDFFKQYDNILTDYMKAVDIDITAVSGPRLHVYLQCTLYWILKDEMPPIMTFVISIHVFITNSWSTTTCMENAVTIALSTAVSLISLLL